MAVSPAFFDGAAGCRSWRSDAHLAQFGKDRVHCRAQRGNVAGMTVISP
jgi:hypothetical protein